MRRDRQARRREDAVEDLDQRAAEGLTGCRNNTIFASMTRDIAIDARWDGEGAVWIATSSDVPGLVVEADTWPAMIEEVRLILPDLLELSVNPMTSCP
jgi:hypothetical protein